MADKIFAIGDIHGCHRQLVTLLARLPLDKQSDTLVFLGDYINRGPDSRKVLDTLVELGSTCARAIFLKGNHEQALLEYAMTAEVEDFRLLRIMGGEATAASYGTTLRRLADFSCLPPEHRQFFGNLQLSFTSSNYLFTHADCADGLSAPADALVQADIDRQRHFETALLASRRLAQEAISLSGPVVVFGHHPFSLPLVKADRIGIDTGAVFGNLLTAVELPALRFYHA